MFAFMRAAEFRKAYYGFIKVLCGIRGGNRTGQAGLGSGWVNLTQ
jgi:hypothetical protein